jgi:hypothetical protein
MYPVKLAMILVFCHTGSMAQTGQTIYGRVVEAGTNLPVIGANVYVVGSDPAIGASSDTEGYFRIDKASLGRVDLRITAVGYDDIYLLALSLVSGKELQLQVEMKVNIRTLDEVVINASENRFATNNEMVSVSGRAFDPELAGRYAGSKNDPARMATNFAGVSGANDGRNDLIIRGNSPSGMLWRVEGIDVPNPNHFAFFGTTGGPISILNYNTLAKSDFLTAAFPAEYGNALAGVFDLQIRDGNYSKNEFLGQVGFNGFELGAEGPFSRKSKSTFLSNFRYSNLYGFKKLGIGVGTGSAVPEFTDLSFKVSARAGKGKVSLWGLGGLSSVELLGHEIDVENPKNDLYGNENQDIINTSKIGILGSSYIVSFSRNSSFRLSAGISYHSAVTDVDSISPIDRSQIIEYAHLNDRQSKISLHPSWYQKIDSRNSLVAGINFDKYYVQFSDSVYRNGIDQWDVFNKLDIRSSLIQSYVTWLSRLNEKISVNTGVHYIDFTLSNRRAVEPRIGMKYEPGSKHTVSAGFGILHQIQPLPAYATTVKLPNGGYSYYNRSLGFTRSMHYVIGHEFHPNQYFRLKTELYYQYLSMAPVEYRESSFSMLNTGDDFVSLLRDSLVNEGKGRNYGIELTVERTYNRHYYYLATVSLFDSRYAGSDKVWRNSAFNGHYVFNLLGGREWIMGKKDNILTADIKATAAGGRYYTPVDIARSKMTGMEFRKNEEAYSLQYDPYFRIDFKLSFRKNSRKITHEWSIDVQNIINRKNPYRVTFNPTTGELVTQYQLGILPIPQYRILF